MKRKTPIQKKTGTKTARKFKEIQKHTHLGHIDRGAYKIGSEVVPNRSKSKMRMFSWQNQVENQKKRQDNFLEKTNQKKKEIKKQDATWYRLQ